MRKVLFVTDNCDYKKEYSIKSKDSEGNKPFARDEMVAVLNKMFDSVYTVYSLEDANNYISNNKDVFVVTTYYGLAEADSKSILPAICKVNGLSYLGADAYTQMICNDKYLSKSYIKNFDLNAIPGVIIYNPNNEIELKEINTLSFPLIIKPNFGGGSNGINMNSVIYEKSKAINLIKQLHFYQNMPIIAEEYIPGYEVSAIIVGNKSRIDFFSEVELSINDKNFFKKEVFGLESKKISPSTKSYHLSNHIDNSTKEKMCKLFQSFDKVEFMRIDCRIAENGQIFVLELSPDCYIGSHGAFQEAFRQHGYDFDSMLELLIKNSISCQNH